MKINPTGSRRPLMRRASGDAPWVRDQQRPRSRPHEGSASITRFVNSSAIVTKDNVADFK